jgi:hypothetical protein
LVQAKELLFAAKGLAAAAVAAQARRLNTGGRTGRVARGTLA